MAGMPVGCAAAPASTPGAQERVVSPDPLPIPAPCQSAYDRYAADLSRSALAARTQLSHARCVRRFLRWLPAHTGDITAVLSQPPAWQAATGRFLAGLVAGNGPLSTDVQTHRFALADCGRRLGLAEAYLTVPERLRCFDDAYTAADATSGLAAATRAANLGAVRAFLRWLDGLGYSGDLRGDWVTVTSDYLQHMVGKGNAASTVLRQRAGLNHCARCLGLPQVGTAHPPQPGRGRHPAAGKPDRRETADKR
jgi:hypothetical protein